MNKSVLALTVVIGVAGGVAIMLRRDLQHERARADALAERIAVLEPVERPSGPTMDDRSASVREASPTRVELARELPPSSDAAEQPNASTTTYRGSRQARQQVERLQSALTSGTPLQDYQIHALIAAIDRVRDEIATEKKNTSTRDASSTIDWKTETNDRLIQDAADILFESQLETFIEVLKDEN